MMNRREWLRFGMVASPFAVVSCSRKKSPRYQGYALIASRESGSLSIIDLSRFQRLKEIPLTSPPSIVVAVPDHLRAYIFSPDSAHMEVLNLDTFHLEKPVSLRGKPQSALVSPDGKTVWVLMNSPSQLAGFDAASGTLQTKVALPAPTEGFDVHERSVVCAFPAERRVGCYRLETKQLTLSPVLDASPHLVRLRPDGDLILAANTEDRSITILNATSLHAQVNLPLAVAPRHLCFNNDGGQLFVTGEGMDAVVIVNPYQSEVSETILAGNAPGSMAVTTAAPNYLFVANPQSGDITVINIDNRRVLAQIAVGQAPRSVLVTPDNEYALVLNEHSGDVAVVRLLNIRLANAASHRHRTASLFTLIAVGSEPVSGVVVPRIG